ncbi:MAG: MBL fold metallo-hydrolase [Alphaproteobacteria bacterium]
MQISIVGCGDAFGAGGRLQTSFYVRSGASRFLIDCGATTLVGMRRLGISLDEVDTVFITHLHGDHFGGLPWLLLDAKYMSGRPRPLIVVGPKEIEARFVALAEALYPNSSRAERTFDLVFVEYETGQPLEVGSVTVTPFEVHHPSGATPYALRFNVDGKVIAFTGDTGWIETLFDVARGADLFITECFQYDETLPIHLDYKTIDANYDKLGAKQILLTHMGEGMLAELEKVDASRYMISEDGMILDL